MPTTTWVKVKRKLNLRRAGAMAAFVRRGSALHEVGWFRSSKEAQSVDRHGKPIPWFTYSALYFLTPRVQPSFSVFEFGSGNSTIWWAQHTRRVVACEDDAGWYDHVHKRLPANAKLLLVTTGPDDYAATILKTRQKFDIIVIDGSARNACAHTAAKCLTPTGVIIFDNADRPAYTESTGYLVKQGFKRLDFFGLAGIDNANNVTSIFYKDNNCLAI